MRIGITMFRFTMNFFIFFLISLPVRAEMNFSNTKNVELTKEAFVLFNSKLLSKIFKLDEYSMFVFLNGNVNIFDNEYTMLSDFNIGDKFLDKAFYIDGDIYFTLYDNDNKIYWKNNVELWKCDKHSNCTKLTGGAFGISSVAKWDGEIVVAKYEWDSRTCSERCGRIGTKSTIMFLNTNEYHLDFKDPFFQGRDVGILSLLGNGSSSDPESIIVGSYTLNGLEGLDPDDPALSYFGKYVLIDGMFAIKSKFFRGDGSDQFKYDCDYYSESQNVSVCGTLYQVDERFYYHNEFYVDGQPNGSFVTFSNVFFGNNGMNFVDQSGLLVSVRELQNG